MAGGKLPPKSGGGGQFYPPTVLAGVTPAMRIWREEVFGPVMAVVPFTDDDHAVAIANDCPFGLGSSVFSRNRRRARAIGARLEVGRARDGGSGAGGRGGPLLLGRRCKAVEEKGWDDIESAVSDARTPTPPQPHPGGHDEH